MREVEVSEEIKPYGVIFYTILVCTDTDMYGYFEINLN